MKKPPSQLLKEAFDKLKEHVGSEEYILQTARECLLSPAEVRIWFDHLTQIRKNRKRGAEKAAATRRRKREQANAQLQGGQVPTRTQPNTQEQTNTHRDNCDILWCVS